MNKILKQLGYSDREIRTLDDFEKKFLIDNSEVLPSIKSNIIEEYPNIPEDKILKSILMSIRTGDDSGEFFEDIKDIVRKTQRDFKLSKILSESKIYSFTDFTNKLI